MLTNSALAAGVVAPELARGSASVNEKPLREGDGAGVSGEEALRFLGTGAAEILVFDLK